MSFICHLGTGHRERWKATEVQSGFAELRAWGDGGFQSSGDMCWDIEVGWLGKSYRPDLQGYW